MSYIKIKVLNLTPQIGGSKRRSKSKKRKSKKSKKRKSKRLNLTPQQKKNAIEWGLSAGLSLGTINAIMNPDSYINTMMRAKKEGRSSFKFRGRMFYGTPHPRLGMIYKEINKI